MALIDLGLVDTDFFNADHVDRLEAAINQCAPAGTVVMTMAAVAPTGWLFLAGQTVIGAQTLYPDWWANGLPAAYKSGANAVLPNMTQRFPIGQGTAALGTVGGANSKTLIEANLPPHAHVMNHDHGAVTSGGQSAHHIHFLDMAATGFSEIVMQTVSGGGAHSVYDVGDTSTGATIGGVPGIETLTDQDPSTFSPANHTHSVDLPNYVGNTGNGNGTATAIDTTPAYLALNFMVKVH